MDYRLLRIILIDSYCRNRIAEVDVSDHITINGENGAGKTTLLRLLPMFFGERPSRIIKGNAVTERFGRYYFPTTASYVVFEYQRRGQKALAIIHASGQTGDGVEYRFIDSAFKLELFKDSGQVVQSRDLYRHVDKQGVFISKALSLHQYQQVIQNTASREFRNLAARFSFAGGTGRLTHLERVVTGILQRATTFFDLKRMIVSAVLPNDEGFMLRTGRRDLTNWVAEYEAHFELMAMSPLMSELETSDHHRRIAEIGFTKLHSQTKLLHDYYRQQIDEGENSLLTAKSNLSGSQSKYAGEYQHLADQLSLAQGATKSIRDFLAQLLARKSYFDQNNLAGKMVKVDALDSLNDERAPLVKQLSDLESQVKSITQVFDEMADQAKTVSGARKSTLEQARSRVITAYSQEKTALAAADKESTNNIREAHVVELEKAQKAVTDLTGQKARLEGEVNNARAESALEDALAAARERQQTAMYDLEALREQEEPLRNTYQKLTREFSALEQQITTHNQAIEKVQLELDNLLAADNAGEHTFLGFLRHHKPDWASNIGRLVSAETLLRTDLSPALSEGDNLYGVAIDLEKLQAGLFSNEEAIQEEIKLAKNRLEVKTAELHALHAALEDNGGLIRDAKASLGQHEFQVLTAKNARTAAEEAVKGATIKVQQSHALAVAGAKERLANCNNNLEMANTHVLEIKQKHKAELIDASQSYDAALRALNASEREELEQITEQEHILASELEERLTQIDQDRTASLKSKGVATDVLESIRDRIRTLERRIAEAQDLRHEVAQYREWLDHTWSQKTAKEKELEGAKGKEVQSEMRLTALARQRDEDLGAQQEKINQIEQHIVTTRALLTKTQNQLRELSAWPLDIDILESLAGDVLEFDIDQISSQRKRLQDELSQHRDVIRRGVEKLRRQMSAYAGTGPEKFYTTELTRLGYPVPGKEYEWLEVFRSWFNEEHVVNRNSLLQQGKTMAQKISAFWNNLNDFKKNVSIFASQLRDSLGQGSAFASISDVNTEIRANIDTQDYWEAVGNLHREYDAWHAAGSYVLPPASFVDAAREVARVVSEETGLIADPVDLISLKISANVNNQGSKTASNEQELAQMSSNGLSYIILCIVLIGFVNRIRGTEPVVVPFVVDELKDLSFPNAKTLLRLMSQNHITMISAFPDVDLDLAELFSKNYKILPGRKIGMISLDEVSTENKEVSHV